MVSSDETIGFAVLAAGALTLTAWVTWQSDALSPPPAPPPMSVPKVPKTAELYDTGLDAWGKLPATEKIALVMQAYPKQAPDEESAAVIIVCIDGTIKMRWTLSLRRMARGCAFMQSGGPSKDE